MRGVAVQRQGHPGAAFDTNPRERPADLLWNPRASPVGADDNDP